MCNPKDGCNLWNMIYHIFVNDLVPGYTGTSQGHKTIMDNDLAPVSTFIFLLWMLTVVMIMMKLMIATMGAEVNRIRLNQEAQFRLSQARLIADMEIAKLSKADLENPDYFPEW